jgi:hypothetical protein
VSICNVAPREAGDEGAVHPARSAPPARWLASFPSDLPASLNDWIAAHTALEHTALAHESGDCVAR